VRSKLVFFLFSLCFFAQGVRAEEQPKPTSLTLREALLLARRNHPLIKSGLAGIQVEQGLATVAASPHLPQLVFNNSYTRANSHGGAFGASDAFTIYQDTFNLSQMVTDFGKTANLVEAGRKNVVQAEENLQNTVQGVLFAVYQDYYQVQQAEKAAAVQRENVVNLQRHLDQAQTFFSVGTQPKIDVTQAKVNLSNGKLSLVQAENNLAIAVTNLKAAMGEPNFGPITAADPLITLDYSISLDDSVSEANANRPDLKALIAAEQAAYATYLAYTKGHYPALIGTAGYGWIGPNWPPSPQSWSFGATLNIPLFNGLLTEGQIRQYKGAWEEAKAQVENLSLTIRQGVEQAHNNMTSAKTSLQVAEESLRYAKENFELAEGRYKVGVGNYLEYTDARVNLTQAETNEIQARANYNTTIAALKQAIGILEGP
jgi:TolC family type I secretion outer membrane protein